MYKGCEIYIAVDGGKYAYSIWDEDISNGTHLHNETDYVFNSEDEAEDAAMIWIDKHILYEGD